MPNDITVSIPLTDLVQLYNAVDMLVDEIQNADATAWRKAQVVHPDVVDIATSRRDKFKVLIRNGLDLHLGGA